MLPFLKVRSQPGVSMTHKADGGMAEEESVISDSLLSVAQELIECVKAGDPQGVAECLQAAVDMCSYEEEPEHLGPPSEG